MRTVTRRGLLAGGAVIAGGVLAACSSPAPKPSVSGSRIARDALEFGRFSSGSSCIGSADGQFAAWRGKPTTVAATWAADGGLQQVETEWATWTGNLDYAPQYRLDEDGGFTWSSMAQGRFDDRIRQDLAALRNAWGDRAGSLYYRFQHEFNGDWYPWAITDDIAGSFVDGWRRFAGLFREATAGDRRFRIVWSPNGGTQSQGMRDVRAAWPGEDVVDVIGVDYYDFFPILTPADWARQVDSTDLGGGPVGIGAWRDFAAEHGKPLALPEWGNQYGDNPLFIEVMHALFAEHVSTEPTQQAGKLLYEVYFNQRFENGTPATQGDFRLMADQRDSPLRPRAAARYRELWGAWSAV